MFILNMNFQKVRGEEPGSYSGKANLVFNACNYDSREVQGLAFWQATSLSLTHIIVWSGMAHWFLCVYKWLVFVWEQP